RAACAGKRRSPRPSRGLSWPQLNHCGIKRLLQEGKAAAKMLAARAGPRPEEEEAFGARTARQVDSVLVSRALRRERALQARPGVDHAIEQQLEALGARDVAE